MIGEDWLEGLRHLEAIDEVSVLCAPDAVGTLIKSGAIAGSPKACGGDAV